MAMIPLGRRALMEAGPALSSRICPVLRITIYRRTGNQVPGGEGPPEKVMACGMRNGLQVLVTLILNRTRIMISVLPSSSFRKVGRRTSLHRSVKPSV